MTPQEGEFQQAVARHQAGQLQEAERLYRAVLQVEPKHPEANHNLGMIAVQSKRPDAALPCAAPRVSHRGRCVGETGAVAPQVARGISGRV